MTDPLKKQGNALENQFFAKVDEQLIEQLRHRQEKVSQRELLATVARIKNEAVLDKLLDHGIDAKTFASLTFVPLAAVAWADGSLDEAERHAILQAAENHGMQKDLPGYKILSQWLLDAPSSELMRAWKDYVAELKKTFDPAWLTALKTEILDQAEQIAETSGGILGLVQKVSTAERKKLDELAKAFE